MLDRHLREAVDRLGLAGEPLLVAASGGIDSTVLLHGLAALARQRGLRLAVGHVNHGLRGAESEADAHFVGQQAEALGLPVAVARVEPQALRQGRTSRERPTLQEAARDARYRALTALAGELGASRIATAHTADDQAETILLRLLRGTGPDGLGGIPERSRDGRVVRPLLRTARAEIERWARDRGLSWREDRSNASDDYTRNRLRRHWIPGLAGDFNPRLLRALGNLAEAQREDAAWIEAQVEREAASRFAREGAWLLIESEDWHETPEALARRLMRWALVRCGGRRDVTRVHLERMLAFVRSSRPRTYIELPGGLRLERDPAGLRLGPVGGGSRGRSAGPC